MTESPHLPDVLWLALALRPERRLPARWVRHLTGCSGCRGEVGLLRALLSAMRRGAEEPSAGSVARAWALMPPRPPRRRLAQRFRTARLVYDSLGVTRVAGVRAPAVARHLVWQGPMVEVDARVEGPGLGSEALLVGQLLPRGRIVPRGTGSAWLMESGRPALWSVVSRQGEFSFPAPRTARWSLRLEWGSLCLHLKPR